MSVYTMPPQQFGQQQSYPAYPQQQFGQLPHPSQQLPYSQQLPAFQLGQGMAQFAPFGQATGQLAQMAPLVTEAALRCAAAAVSTVMEQLRIDPQALTTLQMQGQVTPQAWSNALIECARRIAPLIQTVAAQAPAMPQAQGMGWWQSAPQQGVGAFGPQMAPMMAGLGI